MGWVLILFWVMSLSPNLFKSDLNLKWGKCLLNKKCYLFPLILIIRLLYLACPCILAWCRSIAIVWQHFNCTFNASCKIAEWSSFFSGFQFLAWPPNGTAENKISLGHWCYYYHFEYFPCCSADLSTFFQVTAVRFLKFVFFTQMFIFH